jgi:Fur family ferric uptake transcriptional regulator
MKRYVVEHEAHSLAERLQQRLSGYMLRRGFRSTDQRRHIVETFFSGPAHVSIEELLTRVRQSDSRIGYATVYRTLKMLSDAGVAVERHFEDGHVRFEMSDEERHHDHIICLDCGHIEEFQEAVIEQLQRDVAQRCGFELSHHRHELYCFCTKGDCGRRVPPKGVSSV